MNSIDTEFEFARLSDLPNLVEACAQMNEAEWGDGSEDSIEMRRAGFQRLALATDKEDVVVCLASDGTLVGMCILIENDFPEFEDLRPWLASLIVAPAYRGRGLSGLLIEKLEDLAREFGEETVFLYTKSPDLYLKHDYQVIEQVTKDDVLYTVMGKGLFAD